MGETLCICVCMNWIDLTWLELLSVKVENILATNHKKEIVVHNCPKKNLSINNISWGWKWRTEEKKKFSLPCLLRERDEDKLLLRWDEWMREQRLMMVPKFFILKKREILKEKENLSRRRTNLIIPLSIRKFFLLFIHLFLQCFSP